MSDEEHEPDSPAEPAPEIPAEPLELVERPVFEDTETYSEDPPPRRVFRIERRDSDG